MKIDVIEKADPVLSEALKRLGFDRVFTISGGKLLDTNKSAGAGLKVYEGPDYEFVIQKGRADVITGIEKSNFFLNRGLCSKVKENKMVVLFKFSSLTRTEDLFRVYKNFIINGRTCNDYSVPALYCSFSGNENDLKSPTQLEAFAEQFGYGSKNYRKAADFLSKKY